MTHELEKLFYRQREFQHLCNVNINTNDPDEQNAIAEGYVLKIIEEIIEMRKTFPSVFNKDSKTQIDDKHALYRELSDVLLFLINFCIIKQLDVDDLLIYVQEVQNNNFRLLYARRAAQEASKLK